ncbi:MAG: isoaspartyl peptidase/L-asparaginase [Gemmatimonadota bacterium]
MTDDSRRDFLKKLGVAAGAGAVAPGVAVEGIRAAERTGPFIRDGARQARPVSISSSNGLRAVEEAMKLMRKGTDTLEAAVSGVNIVEEDPEDMTVGYGGLPNYLGTVQLDAQVWHGPTRGAGSVGALEGFVHPSRVAMAVMRYTDHVLLVG